MMRFVLAPLQLLPGVAAAQTASTPSGCNLRLRGLVSPAYLAVNDPCLGANAAKGDGMMMPATFHMVNGAPTLYADHTAAIDVTASLTSGTKTLTISPPIARQDWAGKGISYNIWIPGAGTTATVTTTAAGTVSGAAFTGSVTGQVLTVTAVASGTLAANQLVRDTTGRLIPGTEIVSQATGPAGGTGTYNINWQYANTVAAEAMTSANNALTVSSATAINVGNLISDTTAPTTLPVGTIVINKSGTTVYFSNPFQNGGPGSGDTLSFAVPQTVAISSVSVDGGTITTATNATSTISSVPVTLVVIPASYSVSARNYASTWAATMSGSFWRRAACQLSLGGITLTCTNEYSKATDIGNGSGWAGTWMQMRDQTAPYSMAPLGGQQTPILIHDSSGTCPDQVAWLVTTVNGAQATLDRPAQCAITPSNPVDIYWGVFATSGYNGPLSLSPGKSVEVQSYGSGSTTAAPLPLEAAVSAYVDPLAVTLSVNAAAVGPTAPVASYLRYGTDDTAAVIYATCAAQGVTNVIDANCPTMLPTAVDLRARYVYWPPNVQTFMFSAGQNPGPQQAFAAGIGCGEGRAIWTVANDWLLNTAACSGGPTWIPKKTLIPTQSLKQATATVTGGSSPHFAVIGDSWFAGNTCHIGSGGGCVEDELERAIRDQNRIKLPTITNWSIGGAPMGALDPTSPTYGQGPGIPNTACSSRPNFYQVNCSSIWLDLLKNATPPIDTIVVRAGSIDGSNLSVGGFIDWVTYTQSSGWFGTAGRYPDIVIAPGTNGVQGNASTGKSLAQNYADWKVAGLERSMVRSGWFNSLTTNNGGSIGLVDVDNATAEAEQGWSPTRGPLSAARGIATSNALGNVNLVTGLPWTWQTATFGGYALFDSIQVNGTVSLASFYGTFGNGRCYGVGNGSTYTPQGGGTQTGAATTGYPGGAFCVDYDTGNTHWVINRYLYRFSQTATCSFTASAGGSHLDCSTAVANYGHANASVWLCGAGIGVSTGPVFIGSPTNCVNGTLKGGSGTGNGVSTNGKVLTFTGNIGSTVSSESVTILLYLLQPGDPTDTGCSPQIVVSGGSTNEAFYFYVKNNGDVGISDGIWLDPNSGSYPFQEQGFMCQWRGVMAGFFGGWMYPTLFTEDNTAHTNIYSFGGAESGNSPNASGIGQYAPASETRPSMMRLTPLVSSLESWGMPKYVSSPFGGLSGFQHTGQYGIKTVYGPLFDAQGWNAQ